MTIKIHYQEGPHKVLEPGDRMSVTFRDKEAWLVSGEKDQGGKIVFRGWGPDRTPPKLVAKGEKVVIDKFAGRFVTEAGQRDVYKPGPENITVEGL